MTLRVFFAHQKIAGGTSLKAMELEKVDADPILFNVQAITERTLELDLVVLSSHMPIVVFFPLEPFVALGALIDLEVSEVDFSLVSVHLASFLESHLTETTGELWGRLL